MARPTLYPWIRYWTTRADSPAFAGYDLRPAPRGFLTGILPVRRLEEYRDVSLLVLLGQPGLGKSTAIGEEIDALKAAGIPTERIDLLGLDTGELLRSELAASVPLEAWRGGAELHLFIDGLDRALVDLSTIQRVLEKTLGAPALAMARLRLRLVCRTADWEDAVSDRLAGLWPERAAGAPGAE